MRKSWNMTTGDPTSLLWRFALPTVAGNLLHQAYSITDSIVVGRYLGQTALAAVGCTAPVTMLLAALMIGINTGVGILISQYAGRKDQAGIRRALVNSLYLGLAMAAALAAAGLWLAEPILRWMGTPEGPLQGAVTYLRINFMTSVCPLFYYLFSSVFRGLGASRTAPYCLAAAAAGNVGLDVLFVTVFHWGIAGTAWATALAQALSALLAAVLLIRRFPELRPRWEDCRLNPRLFHGIAVLALPIALQSAFNNLSNLVAQSGVNTFGETVMAAYTAAGRIGGLALMPVETIASALSIYAGQNHGACRPDRVRQGIFAALRLCLAVSMVIAVVLVAAGGQLAKLFLEAPSVELLAVVRQYLLITAVPSLLAGMMNVFMQTLRGTGHPGKALAGGLVQLGTKILVVAAGAWGFHDLAVVWLGWPLSFITGSIIPAIYCFGMLRRMEQSSQLQANDLEG